MIVTTLEEVFLKIGSAGHELLVKKQGAGETGLAQPLLGNDIESSPGSTELAGVERKGSEDVNTNVKVQTGKDVQSKKNN